MRTIMTAAILVIASAASAIATPPSPAPTSPALDKALRGKVAGKPVSCISLPRVQGTTILHDPDAILYRMSSRLTYRNQPAAGCGFRGNEIIVSRTPSDRLCAGDIVFGVDRGSRLPSGSCGLGEFVPYTSAR